MGKEVVTRVEVIQSVRSGHTEKEVSPAYGKNRRPPVEASYISDNWAIATFGDSDRSKGGHLLEASPRGEVD
jgi:hypothetical protein